MWCLIIRSGFSFKMFNKIPLNLVLSKVAIAALQHREIE